MIYCLKVPRVLFIFSVGNNHPFSIVTLEPLD